MRYWSVSPVSQEEWAVVAAEVALHNDGHVTADPAVVVAGETIMFYNRVFKSITINPNHTDIIPSLNELLSH